MICVCDRATIDQTFASPETQHSSMESVHTFSWDFDSEWKNWAMRNLCLFEPTLSEGQEPKVRGEMNRH